MQTLQPNGSSPIWIDEERWQHGLTIEAFVQRMQTFHTAMRRRVEQIRLTPFERNQFAALKEPVRALVLTEDWCSDSLMNVPILAQAAHSAKQMEVKIFPRCEWPDLREALEERGIQSIPAVIFLTQDFSEIGIWVERPKSVDRMIEAWKQAHPLWGEITSRQDISREEKRTLLDPLRKELLEEMYDWYDLGLQCDTVTEFRAILAEYLPK